MSGKLFLIIACVFALTHADDQYTHAFDNVDAKELINNEEQFKSLFDCMRGVAQCSDEFKLFKDGFEESLKDTCETCSQLQKDLARDIIEAQHSKWPKETEEMVKKIDSDPKKFADWKKVVGVTKF